MGLPVAYYHWAAHGSVIVALCVPGCRSGQDQRLVCLLEISTLERHDCSSQPPHQAEPGCSGRLG